MRNFSSKDEVKRFIFNCDYYEMSSLPDEYRLDPEIAEFVSKACPIKLFYLHKKLFSNKELILNGTRADKNFYIALANLGLPYSDDPDVIAAYKEGQVMVTTDDIESYLSSDSKAEVDSVRRGGND